MRKLSSVFLILVSFLINGCAGSTQADAVNSDVKQATRSQVQSRSYNMNDDEKMINTIVATLKDFNFVIDNSSVELGTVNATKVMTKPLKIDVVLADSADTQTIVHATIRFAGDPISGRLFYQSFFKNLSANLGLEGFTVESK